MVLTSALGISVGVFAPLSRADTPDRRLDRCLVGTDGNSAAAAVEIPAGLDYRDILPAMGRSPELEGVSGAFVVVYAGDASVPGSGRMGDVRRTTIADGVCVVLATGERIIYQHVSRLGMRVPSAVTP